MSPVIKCNVFLGYINAFSYRYTNSCEKLDRAGKILLTYGTNCSCRVDTHTAGVMSADQMPPRKEIKLLLLCCQSKDCWYGTGSILLTAFDKGAITFLCSCVPSKEDTVLCEEIIRAHGAWKES